MIGHCSLIGAELSLKSYFLVTGSPNELDFGVVPLSANLTLDFLFNFLIQLTFIQ